MNIHKGDLKKKSMDISQNNNKELTHPVQNQIISVPNMSAMRLSSGVSKTRLY